MTSAHIPCAIEATKAGCHIFLEKPISSSMDGVEELAKIAAEKGLKIFVGFQNRYNPAIIAAKEIINDGTIGSIISVHSEVGERLIGMGVSKEKIDNSYVLPLYEQTFETRNRFLQRFSEIVYDCQYSGNVAEGRVFEGYFAK